MEIKVPTKLLRETSQLPKPACDGNAGSDFYADVSEPVTIPPKCDAKIPLGVAMEIPPGKALLLWPRSGLDADYRIGKHAGVVDSSYRGEIHACLHNRGESDYIVERGDRVVQGVIQDYYVPDFVEVDKLNDSDRGAGGFGSTGK